MSDRANLYVRLLELKYTFEGSTVDIKAKPTRLDYAIDFCFRVHEHACATGVDRKSNAMKPWCFVPGNALDMQHYATFVTTFSYLLFNPEMSVMHTYEGDLAENTKRLDIEVKTTSEEYNKYFMWLHSQEPRLCELAQKVCPEWNGIDSNPSDLLCLLDQQIVKSQAAFLRELHCVSAQKAARLVNAELPKDVKYMRKKYGLSEFGVYAGALMCRIMGCDQKVEK